MEEEIIFKKKGMFDYVRVEKILCQNKYLYQKIIDIKEKKGDTTPFLEEIETPIGGVGSQNGRIWLGYSGNLHGGVGIPCSMFKNSIEQELFPLIAAIGVMETMNKYAPGEYCAKYPNDVICKKHQRKTSGILVRKEKGWAISIFCVNFIKAPADEVIRKDGFKACCMNKHTKNIPEISDFLYEYAMNLFEMMKKYDNVYKVMDLVNKVLSENGPQIWRGEVNNPNADPLVDGALWTRSHPNALTKGYLKGKDYEFNPTYYDIKYYNVEANSDIKESSWIIEGLEQA